MKEAISQPASTKIFGSSDSMVASPDFAKASSRQAEATALDTGVNSEI
jgi:hypothetical protein